MMSEKLTKINEDVTSYNKVNNEKVMKEIQRSVAELNKDILTGVYEEFCKAETPMLEALKNPYFKLKKLFIKELDDGTFEAKVDDSEQIVNIMSFEDWYINEKNADVKDGSLQTLSANYQWRSRIERVAHVFALRIAKEFGEDLDGEKYKLSSDGTMVQLPKTTSNTQTEKLLQFILDGIVFVPNAKSPDVNSFKVTKKDILFIEKLMCREGKKTGIKVPRQNTMLRLITKMANRIVTSGSYEIE